MTTDEELERGKKLVDKIEEHLEKNLSNELKELDSKVMIIPNAYVELLLQFLKVVVAVEGKGDPAIITILRKMKNDGMELECHGGTVAKERFAEIVREASLYATPKPTMLN